MANITELMPEKGKPVLWEELSWKEIESLTKTVDMVISPVGACEQHGQHLPLGVDTIDCYDIAKRVSAKTGVPVIPPIMYGCSQTHQISRNIFHQTRNYDKDVI